MKLEDVETEETEPHPSGVSYVKIGLWTDGDTPGTGDPAETVGINLHAGESYAIGNGEVGTADEWIEAFVESHLSGECDCLD